MMPVSDWANSSISAGIRMLEEGHAGDGLQVLEQALVRCERSGDEQQIAWCLRWVGAAHAELGSIETAIRFLRRAVEQLGSSDDASLEADCRGLLGVVLFEGGYSDDAIEQVQHACALSESCGDIESEASCSSALAEMYEKTDRCEQARLLYRLAAERFLSLHCVADSAENRESAGLCSLDLGEAEAARADFGLACELYAREGDVVAVARCQFLLGVCSVEDDPGEAERNLMAAIDHLGSPEHSDLEGDCWEQLGNLYLDAERVDEALDAFENALILHRHSGRAGRRAHCYKQIGRLHAHVRAVDPAIEAFESARDLYSDVDPIEAVDLDITIGCIVEDLGRFSDALVCYTRARNISTQLDDHVAMALCDMHIGTVRMHLGDHAAARALLVGAAAAFGQRGARVEQAQCLRFLSSVQPCTSEEAVELLAESLRLIDGLSEVELEADCRQDLALVEYLRGNYENAASEYESARDTFLGLGSTDKGALCLQGIGICLMGMGRYEDSERALVESRIGLAQLGIAAAVAVTDSHLGQLYLDTGRYESAEHTFRRARKGFEAIGASDRVAMVDQNLGGLYFVQDDLDAAESSFSRAREQFAYLGDRAKSAVCQCNIGAVLFKKAQFARASSEFGIALVQLESTLDHRAVVAWAHRNRACAEFMLGDKERSLAFLGSSRQMSTELDMLTDVAKCDFLAALCQASVSGPGSVRAAIDLALPALLYLDAQRFQFASAAARKSWSTTISLWTVHVFEWAAELGDEMLLAELVESSVNSGTHVSEVSAGALAALVEVGGSAAGSAIALDIADATTGVARTLVAGAVLPMRPPPRLSMPDGRIALGQFLDSVDSRYRLIDRPVTLSVT